MDKFLFTSKLLAAFLVFSVGLYELGKHGFLPETELGNVPLAKNAVDFTTGVGDRIETISMEASHTVGAFLSSPANRQAVLDKYPLLRNVGNTAGKIGTAVSNTFFPNDSVKKTQAQAKKKMSILEMALADKQKQIANLNQQVAQLHDQIHTLDETANPMKSLIPTNGANFLSLGPASKPSSLPQSAAGAPFVGPNSSAPTFLGAPFSKPGSSPPLAMFSTPTNSGGSSGSSGKMPDDCICP